MPLNENCQNIQMHFLDFSIIEQYFQISSDSFFGDSFMSILFKFLKVQFFKTFDFINFLIEFNIHTEFHQDWYSNVKKYELGIIWP